MRALVAGLAAAAVLAGCGGGGANGDAAARATVTRYFTALGQGRASAACHELTEPSQEKLAEFGADALALDARSCAATMQRLLDSPAGPRLRALGRHVRITGSEREGGKIAVRVAGVAKPIEVRSADSGWRIESEPSVEPDKLPSAERDADGR
jgi:hypothetical protein